MAESDLSTSLEGLFREVREAHHQAYIETDGADPEWPLWYAEHLRERLGALLNASFTKSELVYMLILVVNEQPLRAPGPTGAVITPSSSSGFTFRQGPTRYAH